jgi:hypothetical protein
MAVRRLSDTGLYYGQGFHVISNKLMRLVLIIRLLTFTILVVKSL